MLSNQYYSSLGCKWGSAVPEVVGAVFVGDNNDGHLGVVFYRVGAVGCVGEVLDGISRKGLEYRFSVAAYEYPILGSSNIFAYTRSACPPSNT